MDLDADEAHADAIDRLRRDIDHPDGGRFLLEHLAEWGPSGIHDLHRLAQRALAAAAED